MQQFTSVSGKNVSGGAGKFLWVSLSPSNEKMRRRQGTLSDKAPSSHAVRRIPRRNILTGKTGARGTLASGLSEVAVVYKALAQKFSSPVSQMFSVLWTLRLENSWKNYPKWDVGKKFDSVISCENVKKSFKWASLESHTTNTRHSQWNWIFMKIFVFKLYSQNDAKNAGLLCLWIRISKCAKRVSFFFFCKGKSHLFLSDVWSSDVPSLWPP